MKKTFGKKLFMITMAILMALTFAIPVAAAPDNVVKGESLYLYADDDIGNLDIMVYVTNTADKNLIHVSVIDWYANTYLFDADVPADCLKLTKDKAVLTVPDDPDIAGDQSINLTWTATSETYKANVHYDYAEGKYMEHARGYYAVCAGTVLGTAIDTSILDGYYDYAYVSYSKFLENYNGKKVK